VEVTPEPQVIAEFGRPPTDVPRPRFRRGAGCAACGGTGYRGRTGIYELMHLDDEIRARVPSGAPAAELRALAERHGLVSLRSAGWAKACAGVTTIDEVLRVTRDELL
jgi:type IV pilus assembly protein PilB